MSYTNSQAFAGRGSKLQYSTNPPSVAYTTAAEIKTIQFSGAKYDMADVSNFDGGNFREFLPTLADSGDLSVTGNLIPNDTTESDIRGFFNAGTRVTWEVVLPGTAAHPTSEGTYTFKGFVQSIDINVPNDKEASITIKIKITGQITFTPGS